MPTQNGDLVAAARSIAGDVLARHADDVDRAARFPEEGIAALAGRGLLGIAVPEEHGGAGRGPRAFAGVVEALAQACGSTAMVFVMHVTATRAIVSSTTLASRDAVLRDVAAGRHLTTLALSERGSRSHFWAPLSRLEAQGDGFTTSAAKSWVTAASRAQSYVASAQKPGAASPLESTIYLVRRESAGVKVAGRFDGLGLRGNDSAPVDLDGVAVRRGDLVTEPGAGAPCMLEVVLPWFAIGTASMAVGLCRAAVDATAKHLSAAGLEHVGQKLRDLPTLRARLARMSVKAEQAAALLEKTLGMLEAPTPATPLFVLEARLAALEAAVDVTDLAMKACGGAAFSRHLPVERLFRDARAGWVMAPTVDQLEDFIGKALTGLPLF